MTLGREVELVAESGGFRRTPRLDDVLQLIRGEFAIAYQTVTLITKPLVVLS